MTNKFTSSGQSDENVKRTKSASTIGGDAAANLGPNCANFIAGIIEGILLSSKMYCKCSAHFVPEEEEEDPNAQYDSQSPYILHPKKEKKFTTLYVIKFDPEVTKREKTMETGQSGASDSGAS